MPSNTDEISIDIFICTYKRVDQLKRCLTSFTNLSDIKCFNIHVVDNDPNASAKQMVNCNFPNVNYHHENRKGLSKARNFAIHKSNSTFIGFIDDDEVVNQNWLTNAKQFLKEYNCDVMFGGVESIYPQDTPSWIIELDIFRYHTHPHGKQIEASGSGNVFIKRSSILESGLFFDERFSATGGEDSMLFRQLNKLGYKQLWNDKICIQEYIEPDRLNEKYLLKRAFRDGQCYARSYLPTVNFFQQSLWFAKNLLKLVLFIFDLLSLLFLSDKFYIISKKRRFLKCIGQLSVLTKSYIKMYE